MARFKKTTKGHGDGGTPGADFDSVSELSHTDDERSLASNMSKASAFRTKFLKTPGRKKKKKNGRTAGSDGTASLAGSVRTTPVANGARATAPSGGVVAGGMSRGAPPSPRSASGDARSVGSASRRTKARSAGQSDEKRLLKDAKSRFNIGLVYLKTKDFAKAQDNLEHSLYCHIQLHGHDTKLYTNETLVAIAGVREKLGDCYLANSAIVDKCLALDHYEEAKRLLKSIDPEDAPDNVNEMLERVEEQLRLPELSSREVRNNRKRGEAPPPSSRYTMEGNAKAKTLLGVGAAAGAGAAYGATRAKPQAGAEVEAVGARKSPHPAKSKKGRVSLANGADKIDFLGLGLAKGVGKLEKFVENVGDGILDVFDDSSSDDGNGSRRSKHSSISHEEAEGFDTAMSHLQRENHRTALNYLVSLQDHDSMKNPDFRSEMAQSIMKVADSAMEAQKISVAADAYDLAYAVLRQEEGGTASQDDITAAMRGCIKGHKLLAMEIEGVRDYGSAIQHRMRVSQVLEENGRILPACQQLVRIAFLYGEKDDYAKSSVTLSEAERKLWSGVNKIEYMPADRVALLINCYHSHAICYSKLKKWTEANDQYDELLPLLAKTDGQGGRDYNSALINKAALLVTMGNHRPASTTVNKYFQIADLNEPDIIVAPKDHALAFDTLAATDLKMGNVDHAAATFQKKLNYVNTLPNNDELKSDTMHKLGCLFAYKKQHKAALPMLNEALTTRKYLHGTCADRHKSVFETTWAVAATNHTLGDTDKALQDYSMLLEKMNLIDDLPIDSILIYNSAGKLFFEDGKIDRAVSSFQQALKGMSTSHNPQLKAQITLNLANALSAKGAAEDAAEMYDSLLSTKSVKKTKLFFLTKYNKCLLLVNTGEVEEATKMLAKICENRSVPDDVKGRVCLTLGSLAVAEGKTKEGLEFYERALDVAKRDDLIAIAHAKKSIGMAYAENGQSDRAIETFEDVLEDLSGAKKGNKKINLLKAEVWNCLARVYKQKRDLDQAKNFAKLALQTFKKELGDTNPITLRNKSNLQLLLLEEAEDLQKSDAKSIIDAAKYEMEETLEAFVSLNDPWSYRLDVASLKTNLGFVAVWQGKPKKARKLLRQIQEIEIPPEHGLNQRITILEEKVTELEKKKGK